jgi:electron transport complex protein RnfC
MLQHIGVPAKPIVEVGDIVTEGQLIGEAQGLVSANVHASVPGKVVDISEELTVYGEQKTVVIEADGAFGATGSGRIVNDFRNIDRSDLLVMIRSYGIVGLSGAAFPISINLATPQEMKIDTLIINGTECEPYLTNDDMLMNTYPDEIVRGVEITLKILGIKKAVIGVENDKKSAVSALDDAIKKLTTDNVITIKVLKTKYPQDFEKQLIYNILKRVVPFRGLPMDVGVIVQNVGTIYAINEAVAFNKPLIDRFITVSGEMINRPGNYRVRIGTLISDIVEECGGLKGLPTKIIMGGPMRGNSVYTMDIPVVKGTSGILFLSKEEVNGGDFETCVRCGRCVAACPIGLIPCDIALAAEKGRFDLTDKLHVNTCIMCNCCSYVCPAKRPLSHFVKIAQESFSQ